VQIERTREEDREEIEKELRRITLKIEVKLSVKEYSSEKVAHYLTLIERLETELRELEASRTRLEARLKENRIYVVK
jgi:uncharacterized protein involved in exopolysaccharide biosynthesis